MAIPSPDTVDELRSIQRYLSWAFPTKEIRRSRKGDQIDFDILITMLDSTASHVGKASTMVATPFVIYYDATDHDDALRAKDKFERMIEIGMDLTDHQLPGHKRRIPLWQWPDGGTPAPDGDAVLGYLRIDNVAARVVEQEEPGRYAAVLEFESTSWRVTYDDAAEPDLTNLELTGEVNP